MFRGIIPPIPTPLTDEETIDVDALRRLLELDITAGVHGIWVLGTTGNFDLVTEGQQRRLAEHVAEIVNGRVPLILNVSDMGTRRILEKASAFDDLPYDGYAVLCPWYREVSRPELTDFFTRLADELAKPLVIYNAPWVCNMLPFDQLRELAEHPRIVGAKDVTPSLTRTTLWPREERERVGFSYLHGSSLVFTSTAMGADGFVSGLSGIFPELFVAAWNATEAREEEAAAYEREILRLVAALELGSPSACLEVMFRHRGLGNRISAHPRSKLDVQTAKKVLEAVDLSAALSTKLVGA